VGIYKQIMPLFSPFSLSVSPTVYVVSDSELKRLKEENTRREILEIQKLIDSHQNSIDRLKRTIDMLEKDLSNTETSNAA